jgi:hypothetical protein
MMAAVTVQPGDFCCVPVSGEGGKLIRLGEKLDGSAFTQYQHAEIYVGNSLPEFATGLKTVFRGKMADLYNTPPLPQRVSSKYGWTFGAYPGGARLTELECPPEKLYGSLWSSGVIPLTGEQRNGIVGAAMSCAGIGYSALDYFALAAHRLGMKDPALRRYIASTGHMQCAQLVDYCYDKAGVHLFDDGRWYGYVTPADLAGLIHRNEVTLAS